MLGFMGNIARAGMAAGGMLRRRGSPAPPMQQPMSAAVPATGLGAASDMKPPDDRDAAEPRTFMRSPMQTMGGSGEYRGQASSLRSATRRNNRRAGRALSR